MRDWNYLQQNLNRVSTRYEQLRSRFEQFAKQAADQLTAPQFHIKGIAVELQLDRGFFNVRFAGRALMFMFKAPLEESGTLMGKVECYSIRGIPDERSDLLGEFTFTASGQASLVTPIENERLCISDDSAALYIVLDYLNESLSR